ncbi:hypothetical protein GCM10011297_08530 [Bacterioplanes sanyensis]|nr:hypothetical protein GCM10011297_08530 [Bacterioplanes sanyensis]
MRGLVQYGWLGARLQLYLYLGVFGGGNVDITVDAGQKPDMQRRRYANEQQHTQASVPGLAGSNATTQ